MMRIKVEDETADLYLDRDKILGDVSFRIEWMKGSSQEIASSSEKEQMAEMESAITRKQFYDKVLR